MTGRVSRLWLALCAGFLCALTGGVTGCNTHNPSYFPHFGIFGDERPAHAKPGGPAYYSNFDPKAARVEVRGAEHAVPVRTQVVLIATVYDDSGNARRGRRVDWILENTDPGSLIEVDKSGFWGGRGHKDNTKYGFSFTNYFEHLVTRGNDNPNDDFTLRPGQTWCTISSAVEGETHVTVYAPGINNWEKGRIFTTIRWVDAFWDFPQPVTARFGTEVPLTTRIFRQTDKKPLTGYRVRYFVQDGGAPAVFAATRVREATAISDLNGAATVGVIQPAPVFGNTKIGIEIIRPPEGNSGAGVVIARGETFIEWLAPAIALTHSGPPIAPVGAEITYTSQIASTGKVESRSMTVTSAIPDGLQYLRSAPPAFQEGNQLTWTLEALPPGQSHSVQATYRALRAGSVQSCATVVTEEGLRDEKCAVTQVTTPGLKVTIAAPPTAVIGQPIGYQISVSNPGSGPAQNIKLITDFDAGLEYEGKPDPVSLDIGVLNAGEAKSAGINLTAKQVGKFGTRVSATADGGLRDQAAAIVVVQQAPPPPQAQMSLSIDGPPSAYKDRNSNFTLRVVNGGDIPVANVIVRDRLPPELAFVAAGQSGVLSGPEVVWNVGTLQPKEERQLQLTVKAVQLSREALQQGLATGDPAARAEAKKTMEVAGLPALNFQHFPDTVDPVQVGKRTAYRWIVSNPGSLPVTGIDVKATIPAEMKFAGAKGPVQEQIAGQVVSFRLDTLGPNQTAEFIVEVEAQRPGDVRFRMQVESPVLQGGPLIQEESTRILPAAVPVPAGLPGT